MTHIVEYIESVFRTIYKLPSNIEFPSYNSHQKVSIFKSVSDDFFTERKNISLDDVIWMEWNKNRIPILFPNKTNHETLIYDNNRVIINHDIIASAFYLISGYQEILHHKKDDRGRFPYSESIQNKLNITETPVVNYYFDIIKTALEKAFKINIPYNNSQKLFLSHDIDECKTGWKYDCLNSIIKFRFDHIIKILWNKFLLNKDSWYNFDEIIDLEKRYNAKSMFFFMAQKGRINADYQIEADEIQKEIYSIIKKGWKIGIHGSIGSHKDALQLNNELNKFPVNIKFNRFHFLCFDILQSVEVLEKNGILYDSTSGFAEHIGFRNSICHAFPLWDFKNNRQSNVIEIPLAIMDATLRDTNYMGIPGTKAADRCLNLINEVKKFNGTLSLLWHNNYFSNYKYNGWKDVYLKIIELFEE